MKPLQKVSLKAVEIEVAANPLLGKEGPADTACVGVSGYLWQGTVLMFLFLGLALTALILIRLKKQRHESRELDISEKELFQKFLKAANSDNPAAAMRTLLNWLDHSKLAGTPIRLARFSTIAGDPELGKQIELLETSLYAAKPESQWSGNKLSTAVQQARKNLRNRQSHAEQNSLPKLNPF